MALIRRTGGIQTSHNLQQSDEIGGGPVGFESNTTQEMTSGDPPPIRRPASRREMLKMAGASLTGALLGASAARSLRPIDVSASTFTAAPARICDSRSGLGVPVGPLTQAGSPYLVSYAVVGPTSAIIGGTLIATGWSGNGFIYVVPHGWGAVNPYSMLGYGGSAVTAFYSGFTCALGRNGSNLMFDLYVVGASTQVIIDESVIWSNP